MNNILKNHASKKNITINIIDKNNTINKDKPDNLNNNYNKILTTKNQAAINFNRDFTKIHTNNASNDLLRSVKNFDFNPNNINPNNNNNNNKNTLLASTSTTNFMNYNINNNNNNNNLFNLKSPKNQLSKLNNTNLNNIRTLNIKPINSSATTKNSTAKNSKKDAKEPLQEVILGMKNSLLASISAVATSKLEAKKSQSPIRKEAFKSGSKLVNSIFF